MKIKSAVATALAVLLLAGCASASVGAYSSGVPWTHGSAPTPGSAYSSSAVYVDVDPNGYFGLLLMGLVAAGIQDDYPSRNYAPTGRRPPPLAEDRAIAERDCSQPMETPSANLRCK